MTEDGEQLAAKAREQHEIVYQFLLARGISQPVAAPDSEGIEHHVSPKTLNTMRLYVESVRDAEQSDNAVVEGRNWRQGSR